LTTEYHYVWRREWNCHLTGTVTIPQKSDFIGLFDGISCVHTVVHKSSCDMKTSPG
jgi:hypothetical protein